MKKMQVLQIGLDNWQPMLSEQQKNNIEWTYISSQSVEEREFKKLRAFRKEKTFDLTICTDIFNIEAMSFLSSLIEAHHLVIDEVLVSDVPSCFKTLKAPYFMPMFPVENCIKEIEKNFFAGQSGSKFHINSTIISHQFNGKVEYFGQAYVQLEGDFSEVLSGPILTWEYNIGFYERRSKKIWLEFQAEDVEVSMLISLIKPGGSDIESTRLYSEKELKKGINLEYSAEVGYASFALIAKGTGSLKVGPLHFRDSRHEYGEFITGGRRIKDESQQELFYYFHPGDLKPPLNVYFSGYRTAEGFEGFFMMRSLAAPFLLITDPRLEGGAFYMGSQELEGQLVEVIQRYLKVLGFTDEQLILSGLSMGAYGALYYASRLSPSYVIVGKPLVNVGSIAEKVAIIRPDEFHTSFDLLLFFEGEVSKEAVERLNQRFWKRFKQSNFSNTEFIVAYMENDDYDNHAYQDLANYLDKTPSKIIRKSLKGRHNDNTAGIVQWFMGQYWRILIEVFNRERGNNEL